MMLPKVLVGLILGALGFAPLLAFAAPLGASVGVIAAQTGQRDDDPAVVAQNRGVLQGDVVSVDFGTSTLRLQTPHHGRIDIQLLPSTSILGRSDQYLTIADLTHGTHVSVNVSDVGGHLTAQIIRIR